MSTAPDAPREVASTRRRSTRRSRRPAVARPAFVSTLRLLEALASSGAQVSVHASDLDTGEVLLAGDDHTVAPISGLGAVPVLLCTAAGFRDGRLSSTETARRGDAHPAVSGGLWARLNDVELTLGDLAVLSASVCDPAATNILLARIGLPVVHRQLEALGFSDVAVLDGHRNTRGPDDAPYVAVGSTRELARLMGMIANGRAVNPAVSAQTGEWLTLNADLTLVGAGTGLDPFAHDDDKHGLLFFNKTGRDDGIRAEAGVLAGPRAGVGYAMTIRFQDESPADRMRVTEAMRQFGVELMEYVH